MLEVDFESKLSKFVERSLSGMRLVSVQQLTSGASQQTFKVSVKDSEANEYHYALRRAQPGLSATSQGQVTPSTEAALLGLAADANIPVPTVAASLRPSDNLGEGYLMAWLEGETLGQRIVKIPELGKFRPTLAYQCGQALARIHAIDVPSAIKDSLSCVSPASLVHATWETYIALNTPQPMIDFTAQWLLHNLPPDVDARLVHGDFRNGNLMVSKSGLEAVLDWELCHMGDPTRDLGWLCVNSWRFGVRELPVGGFGEIDEVIAGYESVSWAPVDKAALQFWEVFGSFWWSVTTLGMAETWRTGETPSLERPVIGRRSTEAQMDCVHLLIPGAFSRAVPATTDANLPSATELISSVRQHLKSSVLDNLTGPDHFFCRVALNSLSIAERELQLSPTLERDEHHRLTELLGDGDLAALRWHLVRALRQGEALPQALVEEHLRETVAGRLQIDQPFYSALTP